MLAEPGQRLRTKAFHCQLGHDFVVLSFEVANPAVGQHDIRVQNLTGERIYA